MHPCYASCARCTCIIRAVSGAHCRPLTSPSGLCPSSSLQHGARAQRAGSRAAHAAARGAVLPQVPQGEEEGEGGGGVKGEERGQVLQGRMAASSALVVLCSLLPPPHPPTPPALPSPALPPGRQGAAERVRVPHQQAVQRAEPAGEAGGEELLPAPVGQGGLQVGGRAAALGVWVLQRC